MTFAADCFSQVAEALARRHRLDCLIMGCTEIPLALRSQNCALARIFWTPPAYWPRSSLLALTGAGPSPLSSG